MKGTSYNDRKGNIYDVHTTDSGTGGQNESGRVYCMEM